jgi:hypothetical protein
MNNVFDKEFIVWTKFCIPCIDSEGWKTFEEYCKHRGITITTNRTTYIKELHDKATAIWGGEDYKMFIQYKRAILNFPYAVKQILEGKELFDQDIPSTKPVIKKNKPTRGGKKK